MAMDKRLKRKKVLKSLYNEHHRKLWLFALRHVQNKEVAEDIVHDAFVKLWESPKSYQDEENLAPLLFSIARNLLVNYYKRSLLEQEALKEIPPAESTATKPDLSEKIIALNAAIEGLPPRRKEIFKMSKQQGMTYDEIAEVLSISINTVEVHLVKARQFLREKLLESPAL